MEAEDVKRDGTLLTGRVHPDDRERFAEALKLSAKDHFPFDMEVRNIKPDGQLAWVRSLARSRQREDGAIVWDGIFVDITARKQAEERAAQAYRWLTEAIESLSDGFALWDKEDRLVLWNDKFLFDHPERELLRQSGTKFSTLVEHTAEILRAHMDEKEVAAWVRERVQRHRHAEGTMEVESSSGACLLLTERRTNEGYTVGIYTDISDRKRSGDELQASEQRYRRLVQVSPDAIFVDRDGVIVFANETAARMIGVSDPSELLGTDTLELAASDDRITLASRRRKLREREQTPFGRYRYLRRDGSVGNCESAISSIIWEGEAAILIVIRDIEDRIQAERQQALFGAVLHHAADSIEIVNDDFTLSYVNPAFEEMSGYSSEEVVGKRSMDIFKADEGSAGVYDLVEETLRSGRPWSGANIIWKQRCRPYLTRTEL